MGSLAKDFARNISASRFAKSSTLYCSLFGFAASFCLQSHFARDLLQIWIFSDWRHRYCFRTFLLFACTSACLGGPPTAWSLFLGSEAFVLVPKQIISTHSCLTVALTIVAKLWVLVFSAISSKAWTESFTSHSSTALSLCGRLEPVWCYCDLTSVVSSGWQQGYHSLPAGQRCHWFPVPYAFSEAKLCSFWCSDWSF